MRVMAGIVLFNPDIDRLKENIAAIVPQVDRVLLVDNGSNDTRSLKAFLQDDRITLIENGKNLGIASALKIIMEYAIRNEYEWVLSLDQDSVCEKGLINKYIEFTKLDDVGILTCNISDRNMQSRAVCDDGEVYKEIKTCITSASLMKTRVYQTIAGYDEKMFIDGVDFDICIQIRKAGYKIYRINFNGILHEVGHGKTIKILGKKFETYNHSPFRQYYMARNRFYLSKKYPDEYPLTKEVVRECRDWFLILFYENNRVDKLKARANGIFALKKMI